MIEDWSAARSSYSYIPAKLVNYTSNSPDYSWGNLKLNVEVPSIKEWNDGAISCNYSSIQLDLFHSGLLGLGATAEERLHGFCSAVFWGYASGTDSKLHVMRALARLGWFRDGKRAHGANLDPQNLELISHQLALTAEYAYQKDFGKALLAAMGIKFIGMSFASKIVMFISPDSAAVYDSVISRLLADSNDLALKSLAISTSGNASAKKAAIYAEWCEYCKGKAHELNFGTAKAMWVDWNGVESQFRAVDVERAYFAMARKER